MTIPTDYKKVIHNQSLNEYEVHAGWTKDGDFLLYYTDDRDDAINRLRSAWGDDVEIIHVITAG